MQRIILITFLSVLVGCASLPPERNDEKMIMPAWFWNPPTLETGGVAVGYSPSYYYPDQAIEAATEDAIETLAKQLEVGIVGGKGYIKDQNGLVYMGENVEERCSNKLVDMLRESHKLLDSHVSRGCTTVLISTGDLNFRSNLSAAGRRPGWVKNPPNKQGYIYVVGSATRKRNHAISWMMAERDARVKLALAYELNKKGVSIRWNDWNMGVYLTEIDLKLRGIRIMARWYDSKNRVCHVLARVKTQHIKQGGK